MNKFIKRINTTDWKAESKSRILAIFLVSFVWLFSVFGILSSRAIGSSQPETVKIDRSITNFELKIREMVKGFPIERMSRYIARKDPELAAFIIAIAKKESNWGKRVPVLNGKDCYNYWGYRGIRKKMGSGGHTCFDSPADAVNTISKRLDKLVNEYELDTPRKLIIWKCGNSCTGHSQASVEKWITDVDFYFSKF